MAGGANNITFLEYAYSKDIYILGSGKSLDLIPKSFFSDKVTIGVNTVYKHIPVTYSISHHHHIIQEMIDSGVITVTSEYDMCIMDKPTHNFDGEYYFYKHKAQGFLHVNMDDFDNQESLVCGGTIVIEALHLAYRLYAKNIILCGVDGGSIDDEFNVSGYAVPTASQHMNNVQPQINDMCNKIRSKGVGVFSLNPFNNLTLEGHTFKQS